MASMLNKAVQVIMFLSLKGGVGKSTLSSSFANYISEVLGFPTALWDLDITSPSCPRIFGISGHDIEVRDKIIPVQFSKNLKILSIDFFLPSSDQPIIFKGVRKASVIEQFLKTVDFGDVKYLVLDTPPTTSEELLTILELFERDRIEMVFVTQPSDISNNSVQKSVRYLKEKGYKIKGILSNMSTAECPQCHHKFSLFDNRGETVEQIATRYGIPYLGDIPAGEKKSDKGAFLVGDNFKAVADKILSTESIQFKPTFGKIGALDKLMLAMSLKRGLKKMEGEK